MSYKEKDNSWFFAIFLLLLVIVYFISLGKIDLTSSSKLESDIANTKNQDIENRAKERIKHRIQKLQILVEKKNDLDVELQQKYKWYSFAFRLTLVIIFLSVGATAYFFFSDHSLEGTLNILEVSIILYSLSSFLVFGSIIEFKKFLGNVNLRLKKIVYGKYLNIEKQIANHEEEVNVLIKAIK